VDHFVPCWISKHKGKIIFSLFIYVRRVGLAHGATWATLHHSYCTVPVTLLLDSSSSARKRLCTWCHTARCCWYSRIPGHGNLDWRWPKKQYKDKEKEKVRACWLDRVTSPNKVLMNPMVEKIKHYLKYIISWRYISDVDPLAVNVGSICVMATWTQSLSTQQHNTAACSQCAATAQPGPVVTAECYRAVLVT